jgi:hypothetical protein
MSYLPYVIVTVLFMWTIWMKNLENLMFFLFKRYIYMRNSEDIRFVRVFWYIDSPTNLQGYYKYFTHRTQFPQLTAAVTKRSSAFPTAAFSQQFFHSPQLTAYFAKGTAQPNTP